MKTIDVRTLRQWWIAVLLGVILFFYLAVWLARWFAVSSLLIAAAMWSTALAGLYYSMGGLAWVDRYPAFGRLVRHYAPPTFARHEEVTAAHSKKVGKPTPHSSPPPPSTTQDIDVSRFIDREKFFAELDAFASDPALLRTDAIGVCVLMTGPPGSGRSTMTRYLALRLRQSGAVKSGMVVTISGSEVSEDFETDTVRKKLVQCVGGVVILDNLFETPVDGPGDKRVEISGIEAIGLKLLELAKNHPKRIFVIWNGSEKGVAALDPRNRWLGKFDRKRIDIPPLSRDTRFKLALRLLEDRGFVCAEDAKHELKIRLGELDEQGIPDNADAVRRFVEHALEVQKRRLALSGNMPREERSMIVKTDVEASNAEVIR